MSIEERTVLYLHCDAPGCKRGWSQQRVSWSDIVLRSADDGWTWTYPFTPGVGVFVYCPRHAELACNRAGAVPS